MNLGRTVLTTLLATAMIGAPVLAQAADSSSSPIARTGTEIGDGEAVAGGFLVPLAVILAIIVGILLVDSGSDTPTSP